MSATLLIVTTGTRWYAVRHDEVLALRLATPGTELRYDERLVRCMPLGPLLDPQQRPPAGRSRALIVPARRSLVGLLVEDVQLSQHQAAIQPLSALFTNNLVRPWVVGAILLDDQPVVVLDLPRVARDALRREGDHAANLG